MFLRFTTRTTSRTAGPHKRLVIVIKCDNPQCVCALIRNAHERRRQEIQYRRDSKTHVRGEEERGGSKEGNKEEEQKMIKNNNFTPTCTLLYMY